MQVADDEDLARSRSRSSGRDRCAVGCHAWHWNSDAADHSPNSGKRLAHRAAVCLIAASVGPLRWSLQLITWNSVENVRVMAVRVTLAVSVGELEQAFGVAVFGVDQRAAEHGPQLLAVQRGEHAEYSTMRAGRLAGLAGCRTVDRRGVGLLLQLPRPPAAHCRVDCTAERLAQSAANWSKALLEARDCCCWTRTRCRRSAGRPRRRGPQRESGPGTGGRRPRRVPCRRRSRGSSASRRRAAARIRSMSLAVSTVL